MDAGTEDLRARAMNERNPVHSLLFSSSGALLTANSAALTGIQNRPPGKGGLPWSYYTATWYEKASIAAELI